MRLFDLDKFEEILQTITRNKTRSLLTAFGVFWGVFMLVFLMGGGEGFKRLMAKNFEGFAQNSGFLGAGVTSIAYKGLNSGRTWSLKTSDVDLLKRRVQGIGNVTCLSSQSIKEAKFKNRSANNTNLKGIMPDYRLIDNPIISHGRFITEADLRDHRKVCVIGKKIAEQLFPGVENPCGQFISVDNVYYLIVGVNASTSSVGLMGNAQESISIPLTTMQRIYSLGEDVAIVCFTAQKGFTVTELENRVESVIKEEHDIAPADKQAVVMINVETMFQMVDNLFAGIEKLVWLIGLGTLFSGAVGVSNIMMVTVRERTSEIGIRRAIGARPSNILTQIMSESVALTIIAGLSGITFAVIMLQLLTTIVGMNDLNIDFQINFKLALAAASMLAVLGVLAGLAPSLRALAIKPIDAIRDE